MNNKFFLSCLSLGLINTIQMFSADSKKKLKHSTDNTIVSGMKEHYSKTSKTQDYQDDIKKAEQLLAQFSKPKGTL